MWEKGGGGRGAAVTCTCDANRQPVVWAPSPALLSGIHMTVDAAST
jgi:hypothetical protein